MTDNIDLTLAMMRDIEERIGPVPRLIKMPDVARRRLLARVERNVGLPSARDSILGMQVITDESVPMWEAHICDPNGKILGIVDLSEGVLALSERGRSSEAEG